MPDQMSTHAAIQVIHTTAPVKDFSAQVIVGTFHPDSRQLSTSLNANTVAVNNVWPLAGTI